MHHFQKYALLRICERHGLDPQEIDDTLTFSENKAHLLSMIPRDEKTLIENGKSAKEWYMKEHFLTYYLSVRQQKP